MNETDIKNAATSAEEVRNFKACAAQPGESYTAYLSDDKARITTWTGETLATITRIKSYRWTRGFTTDQRGSFWARGVDLRTYYGTHNGAGMYCRMRLAKGNTL